MASNLAAEAIQQVWVACAQATLPVTLAGEVLLILEAGHEVVRVEVRMAGGRMCAAVVRAPSEASDRRATLHASAQDFLELCRSQSAEVLARASVYGDMHLLAALLAALGSRGSGGAGREVVP